jgi:hypothetical protein
VQTPDRSWSALAHENADRRGAKMLARFRELASLSPDERLETARAMVAAEYELYEGPLLAFTASRLRAWLALSGEDGESAVAVAKLYDDVIDELPAEVAMRRATVARRMEYSWLTADEIARLRDLVPSMGRHVGGPGGSLSVVNASGGDGRGSTEGRPFWKFWSRRGGES